MDSRLIAALVIFALALFVAGGDPGITIHPGAEAQASYIQVTDDTRIYPYTTHAPDFQSRTLAINVIVYAEPQRVERHLRQQATREWNRTRAETSDIDPVGGPVNGTFTAWATANGATRYVYFSHPIAEFDLWLTESYQLHSGDYYGTRYHIRAYDSPIPREEWVAMQAHREHWDWFRLRHTVDGVQTAQGFVEQEFMDRPFVTDLSRHFVGNDQGPDMDGWITIVHFNNTRTSLAFLLAIGIPVLRRVNRAALAWTDAITNRMLRMTILGGALFGLYLFVRFGAITIERTLPLADPRVIAIPFYPVVFAGLPLAAYRFSWRLDQPAAFAAAAIGFTTAILVDYTYLHVAVLPIDTLVHRATLAVALGLIAAGSAKFEGHQPTDDRYFRTGVLLWVVALGLPLIRFV